MNCLADNALVNIAVFVGVIAQVTVLFRINSMSNAIEIELSFASCYFDCFMSTIDP